MVVAIYNRLRCSVQKVNLVVSLIREEKIDRALNILRFSRRRVSLIVSKLLLSAVANAQNNYGLDVDKLYVKEVSLGKAKCLKRMKARARGRGNKIVKHYSSMKIVLGEGG